MTNLNPIRGRARAMRRVTLLAIHAVVLGLGLLGGGPVLAGGQDEATGVQNTDGNPSPTAAASGIDTYTQQEERINIDGGRDSTVKVLRVNQKNP